MISAAMALRLRDGAGPQVQALALIYPGLGGDDTKGSFVEQAEAPFCTTASIRLYRALYEGGTPREGDPYCNPLSAASFTGLPPAFVSGAHFDPLRDDASEFARRLEAVGVASELRIEPQMIHGWPPGPPFEPRRTGGLDRALHRDIAICRRIDTHRHVPKSQCTGIRASFDPQLDP